MQTEPHCTRHAPGCCRVVLCKVSSQDGADSLNPFSPLLTNKIEPYRSVALNSSFLDLCMEDKLPEILETLLLHHKLASTSVLHSANRSPVFT